MQREYLAFYRDVYSNASHAVVINLAFPPHAEPVGSALVDLVGDTLIQDHKIDVRDVWGVVKLPPALWHRTSLTIGCSGPSGTHVESDGIQWRIA